jgi:excisionase family DNA binding protein
VPAPTIDQNTPERDLDTDSTHLGELIRRQLERVQQGPLGPPTTEAPVTDAKPEVEPAPEPAQEAPLEPAQPVAAGEQPGLFELPQEDGPAATERPAAAPPPARTPQPAVAAAKATKPRTPPRVSLAKKARLESIRGRVQRVHAERDQRTLPIELPSRKKRSKAEEETREELLSRLLDPELTLAETAKVLDVCPATVRRYADRGTLPHHRTPGNQRRFKLTDVLDFLGRRDRSVVEDVSDVDV